MKRIAFSILYNAVHHLKHNRYAEEILKMVDLWIVVEGAAGNKGSTSWCKDFYRPASSEDGTVEYLKKLADGQRANMRLKFPSPGQMWESKDTMVNAAIDMIKQEGISEAWLWEIDADEQWTADQMNRAEEMMIGKGAKTGTFLCDYFLSWDLFARGDWGEGKGFNYRRLWNWKGERFSSHEPPELEGGNLATILIPERFRHFAYYFEKDVHFKSQYYGGHENIYKPWLNLQLEGERKKMQFPVPISYLFGNGSIGKSNTFICKS